MNERWKVQHYPELHIPEIQLIRHETALLYTHPEDGGPDVFQEQLKGSPGRQYALQPCGDGRFLVLYQGESCLTVSAAALPLSAGQFSGITDQKFGALSALEIRTLILRHEGHILISRNRPDVPTSVLRDFTLWLTQNHPPEAVFWGDTGALFSAAEFAGLAGKRGAALSPELLIKPRPFRSGARLDGVELKGFHAVGAEEIFDLPVTVAQGGLEFSDAFATLKDLALDYLSQGPLCEQLSRETDQTAVLFDGADLRIFAQKIHTGGANPHSRLLIRAEDPAILEDHEETPAPAFANREDALRAAMQA